MLNNSKASYDNYRMENEKDEVKSLILNGVKSMIIQKKGITKFIQDKKNEIKKDKLTYLYFFLNPDEPPPEPNVEVGQYIPKQKVVKNKFVDNTRIEIPNNVMPYPYIYFCIQFESEGKYIVELGAYRNWPDESETIAFRFIVKVDNQEIKCIEHYFTEKNRCS